jgi:DNA-binding transcriptional MerR regulator
MRIFAASKELEKHRGRNDIRLDELVEIANHLISQVVPEQPSKRVSETISERTLRYYITEGLVDRPLGKEGAVTLYGYRHLLQILAVKLLQGSYLPIRAIREVLADKSNEELEMILADGLEELVMLPEQALRRPFRIIPPGRMASLNRQRLMLREPKVPVKLDVTTPTPAFEREPSVPAGISWERFVLGDGIELHVRTDRRGNLRRSEIRRMVARLLHSLKGK